MADVVPLHLAVALDGAGWHPAAWRALLQDRGVFRTEYEGTTLRDHLGLATAPRAATASRAA